MTGVRTKRWNDPRARGDGFRLLVTRFRPRGLKKEDETWDAWQKELAPSRELLAAFQGKAGEPIPWGTFRQRYLAEMKARGAEIAALAERVEAGETVTLLCSKGCTDESRCHRTVLSDLVRARPLAGR